MSKAPHSLAKLGFAGLTAALIFTAAGVGLSRQAAEGARSIPPPTLDERKKPEAREAVAVFAGGCFWGVQGVFQHVKGVTNAVSGYAGGNKETAHYDMVGIGNTGHAEAVRITYDPTQDQLRPAAAGLFLGRARSDAAQRPGPDIGTQYRSAIFPMDDEQAKIAKAYIAQLERARACSMRPSSPRSSRTRRSIRPRTITRTSWS